MTEPQLTRRQVAVLAGGTALTGLAGCSALNTDESSASTGQSKSPTATQSPSATETPDTTATTTSDATEGAAVVEMVTDNRGTYFDPKGLVVEPGTTVRFVNKSGSHGATAYHPDNGGKPLRIPTEAEPWDTPIYTEPDQRFEVTLDVEGVYDYYCPPHESMGMVGRIIVGEPQDGPGTSPPEDLPPGAQERLPSIEEVLNNGSVSGP